MNVPSIAPPAAAPPSLATPNNVGTRLSPIENGRPSTDQAIDATQEANTARPALDYDSYLKQRRPGSTTLSEVHCLTNY